MFSVFCIAYFAAHRKWMLSLNYFFNTFCINYSIAAKFAEVIWALIDIKIKSKMNRPAYKLSLEYGFNRFKGVKGGVAKIQNNLYVRLKLRHIFKFFGSLSSYSLWVIIGHTDRKIDKERNSSWLRIHIYFWNLSLLLMPVTHIPNSHIVKILFEPTSTGCKNNTRLKRLAKCLATCCCCACCSCCCVMRIII